ncbi:MAG TPA: hypothetical protein VFN49_05525 [Candidatus Aquilonibacter sp.]|nr:hypothetical protein [Candidatus Aquilonibacter sp.]
MAEEIARESPAFFAVHGIDAGDALALATRFDRGWAYRGRQALFWSNAFRAHEVHDRYLPAPPLWPFDRRGLLEVDGDYAGARVTLVAAQLATDRSKIRELRFLREALRRTQGRALLFVAGHEPASRVGFTDLQFTAVRLGGGCAIYARV